MYKQHSEQRKTKNKTKQKKKKKNRLSTPVGVERPHS